MLFLLLVLPAVCQRHKRCRATNFSRAGRREGKSPLTAKPSTDRICAPLSFTRRGLKGGVEGRPQGDASRGSFKGWLQGRLKGKLSGRFKGRLQGGRKEGLREALRGA